MATILEPGREQQGWATETRCTGKGNGGGGCNALLLIDKNDLYETSSSHYDGSTDHYATFKCPACGVETDLEAPVRGLPTKRDYFEFGSRAQ